MTKWYTFIDEQQYKDKLSLLYLLFIFPHALQRKAPRECLSFVYVITTDGFKKV